MVVDNKELVDIHDITEAFSLFYQNIFTFEDFVDAKSLRQKCKAIIPSRISNEYSLLLKQRISIREIERAIGSLRNGKAPGPNGVPIEYYKANIGWISKDLHELYNEAIVNETLDGDINQGIIKLIPKDEDKSLINNWRPITLLNVSYKILAKVLAFRLEKILPKFVCSTQTGFIKGRYILENLITS